MSDSRQSFPRRENGPPSGAFVPVVWRGTAFDAEAVSDPVAISFECEDGSVIRLLLCRESARNAGETLLEAVQGVAVLTSSHPESSSGRPSVAVSAPEECEKA